MAGGEASLSGPVLLLMLSIVSARQEMFYRHLRDSDRRIRSIKRDIKRKLQEELDSSRLKYEWERRVALRQYRRKRAAAFTLFMQQQKGLERTVWIKKRPSGKAFWSSVLNTFDDDQWRQHFRMSRGTFEFVFQQLEPSLRRRTTRWRNPLEPRLRLAIVLWWYANPSEYRNIACLFGVGVSTVCLLVRQVTSALNSVMKGRFIWLPQGETLPQALEGFSSLGYPMCAGAIGGMHLPVMVKDKNHNSYQSKRCWQTILMQAVVDHNSCFTDVFVGKPGRTHEARVLSNSPIYKRAENKDGYLFSREKSRTVNGVEVPVHLIGGSAYPLKKWLMKCFPDGANANANGPNEASGLTPEQLNFNRGVGSACVVVGNAFERLKGRWRCLVKRNDVQIELMPDVASACCVLHNVCEFKKEIYLPEWNTGPSESHQADDNTDEDYEETTQEALAIRDAVVTILK